MREVVDRVSRAVEGGVQTVLRFAAAAVRLRKRRKRRVLLELVAANLKLAENVSLPVASQCTARSRLAAARRGAGSASGAR